MALTECLPSAFLLACLLDCSIACLLTCLLAYLPASLLPCFLACLPACLFACMPACLLACFLLLAGPRTPLDLSECCRNSESLFESLFVSFCKAKMHKVHRWIDGRRPQIRTSQAPVRAKNMTKITIIKYMLSDGILSSFIL